MYIFKIIQNKKSKRTKYDVFLKYSVVVSVVRKNKLFYSYFLFRVYLNQILNKSIFLELTSTLVKF